MKRLWEWFAEKAKTKHAEGWLVAVSFSESSFFIVPPDVLLIAMLSARAGRWAYYAFLTSLASVLGAIFGYLIGFFVFVPIAQPIIDFYHLSEEFSQVGKYFVDSTFLAVLTAAFTPIPFKVFVLAGGFFKVPILPFLAGSIIGRSVRFFGVAWVSHKFGPMVAEKYIENFNYVTIVIVIIALIVLSVLFDLPLLIW